MSTPPRIPGAVGSLGIGTAFLVCAILAAALAVAGWATAALGVGIGLGLYLVNTFFLYATLESLASRGVPQHAATIAGISSVGRLLVLGFALWVVATTLGREAFFGAGGGLMAAQISLFFRRLGAMGGA